MSAILSKAQINTLLHVWEHEGPTAARALCASCGIKPTYMKKLATKFGVKAKPRNPPRLRRNAANDPRWARAIAIGVVVA
jgi:hypothetical protein